MGRDQSQIEGCDTGEWDFSALRAVFLNCTLKKSPRMSHTEGLISRSREIMTQCGVSTQTFRVIDHEVATGVYPDMTDHGWSMDEWPIIYQAILATNILVIGTPILLGEKSSVCTQVIERLYGTSGELNEQGQSIYYAASAGAL